MIEINPKYVEWIKKRFEKPLKIIDKPQVNERKIQQYLNLGNKP